MKMQSNVYKGQKQAPITIAKDAFWQTASLVMIS